MVFLGLICAIDLVALLAACYQAYKARDISDEFSESKNLGLALFTWLQVLVLGLPSLFLVNPENFTAKYFLQIGLLFVLTMCMMFVIFAPLVMSLREYKQHDAPGATSDGGGNHAGSAAVTGLTGIPSSTAKGALDATTPTYTYPLPHQANPMEIPNETDLGLSRLSSATLEKSDIGVSMLTSAALDAEEGFPASEAPE